MIYGSDAGAGERRCGDGSGSLHVVAHGMDGMDPELRTGVRNVERQREGGMHACMYSMYLKFRYGTVQYKALTLTVLP